MQTTYANHLLRPGATRAATAPPLPPRGSRNIEQEGVQNTARYAQLSSTTQGITISTHSQYRPGNVLGHPRSSQTVFTVTLSEPQTIAFAIGGMQSESSSLVPNHNSGYIVLNPSSSLTDMKLPIEHPFQAVGDGKKESERHKWDLPRQRGDSKEFPITFLSPCKGREPDKSERVALPKPPKGSLTLTNVLNKQENTASRSFRDDHSRLSTARKGREKPYFLEHSKSKDCTTSGPEIMESQTKLEHPIVTQEGNPNRDLPSISQPQAEHCNSRSDVLENEPELNNSRTELSEPVGKQMTRISTADSHTGDRDPFSAEEPTQNGRTRERVATHHPVNGTNYEPRSTASGVAVHVPKRNPGVVVLIPKRKKSHGDAEPRSETTNKRRCAKDSDMSRERRNFLKDVYNLFAAPATMEKQITTSSDHLPEDAGQSLPSIEIPELLEDTESAIGRGGAPTLALSIHSASCTAADQHGSTIHGSMREANGSSPIDRANLYQKMAITEPPTTPIRGDADLTSSLPQFEDSPCDFPLDPLDATFPDDLPKYKSGPPREGTYSSTQRQ